MTPPSAAPTSAPSMFPTSQCLSWSLTESSTAKPAFDECNQCATNVSSKRGKDQCSQYVRPLCRSVQAGLRTGFRRQRRLVGRRAELPVCSLRRSGPTTLLGITSGRLHTYINKYIHTYIFQTWPVINLVHELCGILFDVLFVYYLCMYGQWELHHDGCPGEAAQSSSS